MTSLELEEILLHHDTKNTMFNNTQRTMKFVIVGDSNVGKTALCKRIVQNNFSNFYTQSIGVNYNQTNFTTDGSDIVVQHLDIAGFERYSGITQQYYQGAIGALVVFDMTNEKSLEAANFWKSDIDSKCCTSTKEKIPCLLVGTKLDLKDKQEFFKTEDQLEQYAIENGYVGFQAVSSLDGTNVRTAYEKLISYVISNNLEPYDVPLEPSEEEPDSCWQKFLKSFCCCWK